MDMLDRLHRKLVAAAARERPGDSHPGFTIGEVYQQLVPYRAVRDELGLVELAQYEHALLRLLAGERGYAALDLPVVTEELERELASPNPILGIYRDYASVVVRLGGGPPPGAAAPAATPLPPAASPTAPPQPPACPACEVPLPAERDVRFCPNCGASQRPARCRGCGARMNAEWNFCARCGRRRGDAVTG